MEEFLAKLALQALLVAAELALAWLVQQWRAGNLPLRPVASVV